MITPHPYLKKHKILPFHEHIQLRRASFMWKIYHGYVNSPLSKLFIKNLHNEQKYVLPQPKTERDKNQLVYTCVKAWNAVPEDIREVTLCKSFTSKYKDFLVNKI